jgi:hypothetical protein
MTAILAVRLSARLERELGLESLGPWRPAPQRLGPGAA